MSRSALPLLAARGPDGAVALRAPAVGVWTGSPEEGALVGPGAPAGLLRQGRSCLRLTVPHGVSGRVAVPERRDRAVPVGYGDLLFRVAPLAVEADAPAEPDARVDDGPSLRLVAPTDGVYYRAPSPGAPPYVSAGERVTAGQTVGLIEVMKTFNPIAYSGDGLPVEAVVVEILAADGEEVRAGRPLLAVRPA